MTSPAIRVVIIDDHLLLVDSLSFALAAVPDVEVVGTAGTGAEGLALVHERRPDVLLLDQRLPDARGTDLLVRLQESCAHTRVLLMTASEDADVLRHALEGGAAGLITKGRRADALVEGIRAAARGETVLSPADLQRVLPLLTHRRADIGADLTPREREVLRMLASGASTQCLARALVISQATARNHVQSVLSKLGAHSKLEAVTMALRAGIVTTGSAPNATASQAGQP